jgi:hypothetical protein
MIGTGADKREAKRDIHPIMESEKFQRDKSLVMVHAEHPVKLAVCCTPENRIRTERTGK